MLPAFSMGPKNSPVPDWPVPDWEPSYSTGSDGKLGAAEFCVARFFES
jgi:hypothetical protein